MLLRIQIPRTGLNDEIVLTNFPVTIGRAPDNTLVLEDSRVSRHHAKIELNDGKLILTGLGAANGVYLNDRIIAPRTPVVLEWKDRIGIGEFQLWFEPSATQQAPAVLAHWSVSLQPQPGLIVSMGGQVYRYPFDQSLITIGRNPDSTIILDHPMVSRQHGEIHLQSGKYVLFDIGSTNGFFFEGEPTTQHSLKEGDVLTIPGTDIRFEFHTHIGHVTADRPLRKDIVLFRPKAAAALGLLNLKGMEVITIGRSENNRIVLSHPQVELFHAAIERRGSRFSVQDLNSLRGVFVNGIRVNKESWAHVNDEIRVENFRFMLHESGLERLPDEELRVEAVGLKEPSSGHHIEKLSLCFGPNELVAVVGATDALRTSLIEALSIVRIPSSGQLAINGIDLYQTNDHHRHNIGYVPCKDIVHPELSIYSALDYAAQLRFLPNTSSKERQRWISEVLADLELTEQRDRQISKLAPHLIRRVNLGVELLAQPRLLFLDEPTAGLDPAKSAEMMRLLRKLADQDRSVLLTAPISQQIMMCDKVAILTPDGRLAFFGPPDVGLAYLDAFRTPGERKLNALDYSHVQTLLATDQEWANRFLQSQLYQDYVASQIHTIEPQKAPPHTGVQKSERQPTGFWHQFSILTRRNFEVIRQDKIFLGLVLALGPLIGLLNIVWGSDLFDVQTGSPSRIITAMFMAAFTSVLVGIGISVREIVREADIYIREREVKLDLFPYVFSKLTVGKIISLYQSLTLTFFLYLFVLRGSPMTLVDYGLFFVAMFLGVMSGYLIGLVISAVVRNQNWAYPLVIVVLLLQYTFSGALVPLNRIPAGNLISLGTTTHWEFEALVNISGIGRSLVADACWQRMMTGGERAANLTQDLQDQLNCSCMGANLFTQCQFPGIRGAQIYSPAAQQALAAPAPLVPLQPTAIPTLTPAKLTPLPTFTLFPTPTHLSTPTPQLAVTPNPLQTALPTTSNLGIGLTATAQLVEQERAYRTTQTAQQQEYENQLSAQEKLQQDLLTNQAAEYEKLKQDQLRGYTSDLSQYATALENWQTSQETAIAAGENYLQTVVDYYGSSFQGNAFSRLLGMVGIMLILFGLLVLVLKFKKPR